MVLDHLQRRGQHVFLGEVQVDAVGALPAAVILELVRLDALGNINLSTVHPR